jgi:RimJ/RimL family protein N-acetyltransferase
MLKSLKERITNNVGIPGFSIIEEDFFNSENTDNVEQVPSLNVIRNRLENLKFTLHKLTTDDTEEIYDFLLNSNINRRPFAGQTEKLINDKAKIEYYLSNWNLFDNEQCRNFGEVHHLFYACKNNEGEIVAGIIVTVMMNDRKIEVGGFVRDGYNGAGIGSKAGSILIAELKKLPYLQGEIDKIYCSTNLDNSAARGMLKNVGLKESVQAHGETVLILDF